MKNCIVFLSAFLIACCSQNPKNYELGKNGQYTNIEVKVDETRVTIECGPNDKTIHPRIWVKQCNEKAYKALLQKKKEGIVFESGIEAEPFGVAGENTIARYGKGPETTSLITYNYLKSE